METRSLILEATRIAKEKGLTQSMWSGLAGHAINGQTVSRMKKKGDGRISTFLALLDAIGCKLEIKEVDHEQAQD